MSSAARSAPSSSSAAPPWLAALLLGLGLLVMYGPTVVDFMRGPWRGDRNSHGPIVLALSLWFFTFNARRVMALQPPLPRTPSPALGWPLLVIGLLMYAIGRSQEIALFEMGSMIVVLVSLALVYWGGAITRRFWFAFFLLAFAVPLPPSVVDAVTQPMKLAVSWAAEHVLYSAGYPVSRSGVILGIGSYQLLVADACAGLNSLFTLEALGLLYMNVMRHESVFRNVALAMFIVPVSFTANVTRVIILALLTYHFGDEVGQGFMHEFSGMVLFLTALMLIIGVDSGLRLIAQRLERRHTAPAA